MNFISKPVQQLACFFDRFFAHAPTLDTKTIRVSFKLSELRIIVRKIQFQTAKISSVIVSVLKMKCNGNERNFLRSLLTIFVEISFSISNDKYALVVEFLCYSNRFRSFVQTAKFVVHCISTAEIYSSLARFLGRIA